MLDALDKKIICAMQDEFPLSLAPYREIAEKIGIEETVLLERLQQFVQSGKIRKMGAVLRHRQVGYRANALCAWFVPLERSVEIGKAMASRSEVTHCYTRIAQPSWRYNLYTMLHGQTREECQEIAKDLSQNTGIDDYVMLFSTKEWKKTSMKYFREIK